MSKTFDELKQGAEEIRTNVLPDSNTAGLVGKQFLDIIEKQETEQADRLKLVTDYNVSTYFPNEGIENSNRYLLTGAIAKCPSALKRSGQKLTFLQKNNTWVTYMFNGTSINDFDDANQWIVWDATVLQDLGDSKDHTISQDGITKAILKSKIEVNVSVEAPTSGLDITGNAGGDMYTLSNAVNVVSEQLNNYDEAALTNFILRFKNLSENWESWQYKGGSITTASNYDRVDEFDSIAALNELNSISPSEGQRIYCKNDKRWYTYRSSHLWLNPFGKWRPDEDQIEVMDIDISSRMPNAGVTEMGLAGGNRYTIKTVIGPLMTWLTQFGATTFLPGKVVTFINLDGDIEKWTFMGGSLIADNFINQISELENRINNTAIATTFGLDAQKVVNLQLFTESITEINLSTMAPTSGINGTNRYTLALAITAFTLLLGFAPATGTTLTFINADGELESHKAVGNNQYTPVLTYADLTSTVTEFKEETTAEVKVETDTLKKYVDGKSIEILPGSVTPESLSESTRALLNSGGAVVNLVDDEDLETVDGVIKLKNKAHAPANFSGKGRVYLRKNVTAAGKNILTQDHFSEANTIYNIQYDYDLDGKTITIPEGCTLQFDGGSISNGKIIGDSYILDHSKACYINNTLFEDGLHYNQVAYPSISKLKESKNVFLGEIVKLQGYWNGLNAEHNRIISDTNDGSGIQLDNGCFANIIPQNGEVNVLWYGAKGDSVTDDSYFINLAHKNENLKITYPCRTYVIDGNYAPDWIVQYQTYGGIYVNSNQTIYFEEGAKLIFTSSTGNRGTFFQSKGKKNVSFYNVWGIGNRTDEGEWGHGMWIITSNPNHTGPSTLDEWSENIKLFNCKFENMNGDSFSFSGANGVYADNLTAIANRRNGITLSGAINIVIRNYFAKDITGAAPEAAIDIESDWSNQPIGNILIENVRIENCKCGIWNILTKTKFYNIKIRNVDFFDPATNAYCRFYNNPGLQDENSTILWENFNFYNTDCEVSGSSNFIYLLDSAKNKGEIYIKNLGMRNTKKINGQLFYIKNQYFSSLELPTFVNIEGLDIDIDMKLVLFQGNKDISKIYYNNKKKLEIDNSNNIASGDYNNSYVGLRDESEFNSRVGGKYYVETENQVFWFYPELIKSSFFMKPGITKYRLRPNTTGKLFIMPDKTTLSTPTITYDCSVIFNDDLGMFVVNKIGDDLTIKFGTTSQRPTLATIDEGFEYYDSTLKKKILWIGTAWKNLDGTDL